MILNELAEETDANISIVVRGLVAKGLNSLIDKDGNLRLNEKQIQE